MEIELRLPYDQLNRLSLAAKVANSDWTPLVGQPVFWLLSLPERFFSRGMDSPDPKRPTSTWGGGSGFTVIYGVAAPVQVPCIGKVRKM